VDRHSPGEDAPVEDAFPAGKQTVRAPAKRNQILRGDVGKEGSDTVPLRQGQ